MRGNLASHKSGARILILLLSALLAVGVFGGLALAEETQHPVYIYLKNTIDNMYQSLSSSAVKLYKVEDDAETEANSQNGCSTGSGTGYVNASDGSGNVRVRTYKYKLPSGNYVLRSGKIDAGQVGSALCAFRVADDGKVYLKSGENETEASFKLSGSYGEGPLLAVSITPTLMEGGLNPVGEANDSMTNQPVEGASFTVAQIMGVGQTCDYDESGAPTNLQYVARSLETDTDGTIKYYYGQRYAYPVLFYTATIPENWAIIGTSDSSSPLDCAFKAGFSEDYRNLFLGTDQTKWAVAEAMLAGWKSVLADNSDAMSSIAAIETAHNAQVAGSITDAQKTAANEAFDNLSRYMLSSDESSAYISSNPLSPSQKRTIIAFEDTSGTYLAQLSDSRVQTQKLFETAEDGNETEIETSSTSTGNAWKVTYGKTYRAEVVLKGDGIFADGKMAVTADPNAEWSYEVGADEAETTFRWKGQIARDYIVLDTYDNFFEMPSIISKPTQGRVVFHANGGVQIADKKVAVGEVIGTLEDTWYPNNAFQGWFTDETLETAYDAETAKFDCFHTILDVYAKFESPVTLGETEIRLVSARKGLNMDQFTAVAGQVVKVTAEIPDLYDYVSKYKTSDGKEIVKYAREGDDVNDYIIVSQELADENNTLNLDCEFAQSSAKVQLYFRLHNLLTNKRLTPWSDSVKFYRDGEDVSAALSVNSCDMYGKIRDACTLVLGEGTWHMKLNAEFGDQEYLLKVTAEGKLYRVDGETETLLDTAWACPNGHTNHEPGVYAMFDYTPTAVTRPLNLRSTNELSESIATSVNPHVYAIMEEYAYPNADDDEGSTMSYKVVELKVDESGIHFNQNVNYHSFMLTFDQPDGYSPMRLYAKQHILNIKAYLASEYSVGTLFLKQTDATDHDGIMANLFMQKLQEMYPNDAAIQTLTSLRADYTSGAKSYAEVADEIRAQTATLKDRVLFGVSSYGVALYQSNLDSIQSFEVQIVNRDENSVYLCNPMVGGEEPESHVEAFKVENMSGDTVLSELKSFTVNSDESSVAGKEFYQLELGNTYRITATLSKGYYYELGKIHRFEWFKNADVENTEYSIDDQGRYVFVSTAKYAKADVVRSDYDPYFTTDVPKEVPTTGTVSFSTAGGAYVDPVTVELGKPVGDMPQSWYPDNAFLGWYTDKDCTQSFDPSMTLDAFQTETRLYAKFENEIVLTKPWGRAQEYSDNIQLFCEDGRAGALLEMRVTPPAGKTVDYFTNWKLGTVPAERVLRHNNRYYIVLAQDLFSDDGTDLWQFGVALRDLQPGEQNDQLTGTIKLSVKNGASYAKDKDGADMNAVEIDLAQVSLISLSDAGYAAYVCDANENGKDDVNALHAFVYAHQNYCELDTMGLSLTGDAGSAKVEAFWGVSGKTFTMLVNGEAVTASCDTYALKDGDVVEIVLTDAIMLGDVNGDGKINTGDVVLAKAFINGLKTPSEAQISAADVSGDGKINTADVVKIKAYINGKISEF